MKATVDGEREWDNQRMGKEPEMGGKAVPLDLEGLSPEEAAEALKRHNPRITESTEFLAETIRQVRAGTWSRRVTWRELRAR
jgi:hypothetical protein